MMSDIFFLDIFSRPFADCEHVSKINSDYISYLLGVTGVYLIYCSRIIMRTLKLDLQPHLEYTVSVWISCSYERNRDSFIDVHFSSHLSTMIISYILQMYTLCFLICRLTVYLCRKKLRIR